MGSILALGLALTVFGGATAYAGENVSRLACGGYHVIGVNAAGRVRGTGDSAYGQLGDNPATPVMEGLSNIVRVGAGRFHTLALDSDGVVWFAGDTSFESTTPHGTPLPVFTPQPVAGLSHVVQIASGARHDLALDDSGRLWAWGHNGSGQVGDGGRLPVTTPVMVLTNVVAMSGGSRHTVAVQANGSVWAWGGNSAGQLGLGHTTNAAVPIVLSGVSNAVDCAAGDEHTLVLLADGHVVSFGLNSHGQLGDGTSATRPIPATLPGLTNIVSVVAGGAHSAALDDGGQAFLWGRNFEGQCGGGPGAPVMVTTPRELVEAGAVDAISCGRHFTVWRDQGTQSAHGLGSSGDGQLLSAALADAGTSPRYHTPVVIAELSSAAAPPMLSISGTVSGAAVVTGLPLVLYQSNAPIATALPATDGFYSFQALVPGSYDVRASAPENHDVVPTNHPVILSTQDVSGIDFTFVLAPVPEPEVLALYRLDETNGTVVFDASRVTGNGVVTGIHAWQPTGGVLGGGLQLSNGRVLIPDCDPAGGLTGGVWFKFFDVAAQQMLLAQGDPFEVQLQMRGSGGAQRFRIRVNLAGGAALITDSTTQAVVGNWYHVAFRYDGSALGLFINGTKESEVAGSGVVTDLDSIWSVGARNNGLFPALGVLDEVRLYDGALDDDEIRALASPRAFRNGGFEAPDMGTGSGAYAPTPTAWLWAGSNEGAEGANSGVSANNTAFTAGNPPAPEGGQVAYLQREAVLEQVLHLPAGGYQVQFQAAQRGNFGGGPQSFTTHLGTNLIGSFTPAGTNDISEQTAVIYVPDGFRRFRVSGLSSGDHTAFLDDFQVQVSSLPGFWGWQASHHGGTSLRSDPDNDHQVDLMEYALGGDPNDPSTPPGIEVVRVSGAVTVQFDRPSDLPDISYHLMVSSTLSLPSWIEFVGEPAVVDLGGGMERVYFTNLHLAGGVSESLFCRLEVRLL